MDQLSSLKKNTKESMIAVLDKRNVIYIEFQPRSLIIPLNKSDYKTSRVLIMNMGTFKIINGEINNDYGDSFILSIEKLSVLVSNIKMT